MAVEVIPGRLRKTWEIWNIRVVILISLLLQIILFLGAPMRKRTGNRLVILLVWSSYFLAEWATSFALGLITSSQSSKHGENSDLFAFWASFLLLHHGGPDTITTFEENELWLRHFLTLISQVLATLYVFLQTLPESKLWLPTSLIFFVGIIKYAERTHSLYLASWHTFREFMVTKPDPGPEYAKLMEAFSSKKVARLPTTMSQTIDADIKESKFAFYSSQRPRDQKTGSLDEFEVVKYGYHFLKIFKGLIVDLISHNDRNESREFFHGRTPEDALEVLEVELNFIYEVLYTKFAVMHDLKGYLSRFLSSVSVWVSLGIFFFLDCKNGLDKFDIGVTYTLLLGALSLDAIALFKLIFSDRITALLDKRTTNPRVRAIFQKLLKIKRSRWSPRKDEPSGTESRITSVLLRRWSESVAGFNLITYCLKDLPKKSNEENYQCCLGISKTTTHLLHPIQKFGAKDFLDELKYASENPFTKELWNFIFNELLEKSKQADKPENIKTISSARGAYVLEEYKKGLKEHGGELLVLLETLKKDYIENVTYDESLLLWHIATEICYHGSEVDHRKKAQPDEQEVGYHGSQVDHDKKDSDPGIPKKAQIVLEKLDIEIRTCAEAKRFFSNKGLGPNMGKEACENLIAVNTDVKPVHVKGDRSKSVLFDACMLAKELQKLEGIKKWEVISKVWVQMLSYSSNHCRPDAHVRQVSRGGQLINLVWLLMAHFGLVQQFVFTTNFGPAKLIVDK